MNTAIDHSSRVPRRSTWHAIVTGCLAFWLSSSLLLDLVIMPSLYTSGMMASADFVPAGYSLFWVFNRLEVLCAAAVLTGVFVLHSHQPLEHRKGFAPLVLASGLLAISLLLTYAIMPNMSALGLNLNLFESTELSPIMVTLQQCIFAIETLKIGLGSVLLGLCWHDRI